MDMYKYERKSGPGGTGGGRESLPPPYLICQIWVLTLPLNGIEGRLVPINVVGREKQTKKSVMNE